jgi:hypothetical protein
MPPSLLLFLSSYYHNRAAITLSLSLFLTPPRRHHFFSSLLPNCHCFFSSPSFLGSAIALFLPPLAYLPPPPTLIAMVVASAFLFSQFHHALGVRMNRREP